METKYTKEELEHAVKHADSIAETLRNLGKKHSGSMFRHIKKLLTLYDISTAHFTRKKHHKKAELSWQDVLVDNRHNDKLRREDTKILRKALIASDKKYECYECKIVTWQNKQLVLDIHHLDGNYYNNTPENLVFICPNCHRQQHIPILCDKSYKSKCIDCKTKCNGVRCKKCFNKINKITQQNKSKIPTKKVLLEDLLNTKNLVDIAKKYQVNDNTVRKWCKKYDLPFLRKDLKALRYGSASVD